MVFEGLRRVPRPLVIFGLCVIASRAQSQDPMVPGAPWKTLETPHYRVHFQEPYERWTLDVARRVEAVDSAIAKLVGYRTPKRIDVVVHDPYKTSNGYVIPFLDGTTTVWWATPPDPRNEIGNYRTWGEMLATHELAHVAHLTRPSRNFWQRAFWGALPASVGPIARRAPRWVYEGYATVLEGQITGSGRPNGSWRPAILRQWAIEGRLPGYGALSGSPTYRGNDFPYLGGSAFMEWLLKRQGDSSLVHVWRRMTARTNRTFDQAFAGVYGESPALLYGRHAAELTGDAMRVKADLERAGLHEGELVQRLNWSTGDPAISHDGNRIALMLAERVKPSRLVVWNTEFDTVTRRRAAPRQRDPQDVPDKTFNPPTKRPVRELHAHNGSAFTNPRWFADNRRLLVTRWSPRKDGTSGPDVYIWNTASGTVSRVTRGENILQADPSPDSREAVGMRCHEGHCDIVRLYFAIGSVTSLLEGSPTRSYYRPRFSPDGQKFVASVTDSGQWRVIVADRDGKNPRRVGPDDGANRYDASWTAGGDSLIMVSERGGIANLEVMSLDGGVRSVTRVTGAAVAPEVNRVDRSIWYLSLHSRGLDIRRFPSDAPIADSALVIDSRTYGYAGVQQTEAAPLGIRPGGVSKYMGIGPMNSRWLPGVSASADGMGATLTIFRGDIVGRWNTTVAGAYGEPGAWRGASVRSTFRYFGPAIEFGAHVFEHNPSEGRDATLVSDSLDARGFQGVVALSHAFRRDGVRIGARAGVAGGSVAPRMSLERKRYVGFADIDLQVRQSTGSRGVMGRLRFNVAEGTMRTEFRRVITTFQIASTGDMFPIDVSATMGKHLGSRHTFDEFSIGGIPSAAMDTSIMPQRWSMAMLPTGAATGRALQAWRIAFPFRYTLYVEGASLANPLNGKFLDWHRGAGIERRLSLPQVPVSYMAAMQARIGIGYSLDRPLQDKFRAYVLVRYEP